MPWAGNIAKTMTSDRCARHVLIMWLFVFHRFDPFALLYNKSLNDWFLGEQWILFPWNLNVSLNFVSGNIEILWKQNSLFPSGPVINNGNRTEWSAIWSEIMGVILKWNERVARVRFEFTSMISDQNCTIAKFAKQWWLCVFHFPAIWLVSLKKPWNLIGCIVIMSHSH